MKRNNTLTLFAVLLLGGIVLCKRFHNNANNSTSLHPLHAQADDPAKPGSNDFDRHPSSIHYSKHARCRMDCRHIDESEIKEILEKGEINYAKSELQAGDCQRRFAVEGFSHDRQHLRVIFAPCNKEVTVVTCIDTEKEWACSCEQNER